MRYLLSKLNVFEKKLDKTSTCVKRKNYKHNKSVKIKHQLKKHTFICLAIKPFPEKPDRYSRHSTAQQKDSCLHRYRHHGNA